MVGDPRRHQRLGVRGLVLLVVAEAPVADEIDDDVAAEVPAVGEREPDGAQRGGRVVGVHMDDRHVVALRDVARVERRAALGRVGRVADLVVRDQVQRPAGRVAGQVGEVERLGDDALAGEGGVAVDEDAERLRTGRAARSAGAVGLLGARRPSATGSTNSRWLGFAISVTPTSPLGVWRRRAHAEVVLDVAGPALGVGGDRLDRPLALELAQDLVVRAPHHVRQHVEAAAVGHADDDLADAVGGGEVDRLVEHGHQQVEAFERELLLAEERAPQERLEALDLGEARQQAPLLVVGERPAVAAGLDRLAQPHPLVVVVDVLDLVGDRAAVGLAQPGEDVRERVALDVCPQDRGGDALLELGREAEPLGVERGVAGGSVPSGSSRAARWPCVRVARTSDAAAATAFRSASSVSAGAGAGAERCDRRRRSALQQLAEPGSAAARSPFPRSNRARHSGGTELGFSRYCSSSWPA